MSYIVNAATETAVNASISTPVAPLHVTDEVINTLDLSTSGKISNVTLSIIIG